MMKNNNYNNWDDKCNTWSTDESEEEKPILLIYKVTSTSTAQQASTEQRATTACTCRKTSRTIDQAIEYCKKDQDVHEEGRRPLSREARGAAGRDELKLIIQHARETETSTGLQNTIPNGSSLTTHGSRNSNYDNQEYWKGILQTNGGLDLLAQASQDYFGNNTQITTTSNSTNGGMDIMTKRPLLLRNGVPKTSAPGPNLKSGPIGTHSALRSKVARCLKFDPQN